MRFCLCIIALLLLTACNSLQKRIDTATSLAHKNNFFKKTITSNQFTITSFYKHSPTTKSATIYIEGDGLSWLSKRRVSPNPTPNNPIGLKLAINDPEENVFYLARPCQYVEIELEKNCHAQFWTSKRASNEIIESLNEAINVIKSTFHIESFRLVGYSGGGTIATILSIYRDDVKDLRTIAGNLDLDKFVEQHNVSPLSGSINPTDFSDKLISIPQQHYISNNDEIITQSVTDSYVNSLKEHDPRLRCVNIIETNTASHTQGWETYWRKQKHTPIVCTK